jgi:hypothetical protein
MKVFVLGFSFKCQHCERLIVILFICVSVGVHVKGVSGSCIGNVTANPNNDSVGKGTRRFQTIFGSEFTCKL